MLISKTTWFLRFGTLKHPMKKGNRDRAAGIDRNRRFSEHVGAHVGPGLDENPGHAQVSPDAAPQEGSPTVRV